MIQINKTTRGTPCVINYTVLVAYTGQLLLTKTLMPRSRFEGVRLTAVDSYQGEENDIIILSLVISNPQDNIGFLKEDNRVCVALSRAKKGFYVIGNFDQYERKNTLWAKMVGTLKVDGAIGDHLILMCPNHPSTLIKARTAADFEAAPEGGCTRPCLASLTCGHVCRLLCHGYDLDHSQYQCKKPCTKSCVYGRPCPQYCDRDCGDCRVKVEKVIPRCQHVQEVPCYLPPAQFTCVERCNHRLLCGHMCGNVCGVEHSIECRADTLKTLPCGHSQMVMCYERPADITCKSQCHIKLDCQHSMTGPCHLRVKGCGSSWDRLIEMKGTSKGCGSFRDVVIGCGQRDKGYWQNMVVVR